jgi:hypothetical protein
MLNDIQIVIGSWGSYNACNARAYGSKWITLNDYSDWDEIVEELEKQGFELNGIDEELFIQDVSNFPSDVCNWDYMHPQNFFETLQDAGVLDDIYKFEEMSAYLEVRGFEDFKRLVSEHGDDWDCDIRVMKDTDWYDYGRECFENCGYEITSDIDNFFDFEGYGKYVGEYTEEYSEGLIEIME